MADDLRTSCGAHIQDIASLPASTCGCKRFALDALGGHVSTCSSQSDAKKAHHWAVEQLAELLLNTAKVKTSHVARSRGQKCGEIQLDAYIADAAGPALLIMDLRIAHERFGSSSNPLLNGTLPFFAAWILISRSMMMLLIRFDTTVLMIVTITLSLPCLPLPAPLAAFTVSLCAHFVFADAQ
jgi:hypothetical protein